MKQFLLISITLHVIVISILRLPPDIVFAPLPGLEVRLAPEPQRQDISDESRDPPLVEMSHARADLFTPIARPPSLGATSKILTPTPESNIPESPQDLTSSPQQTSAEVLLDLSRRVARDEGRHLPPPKDDGGSLGDRPALPELARALARGKLPAGVTQFADGLLRVVTPSGSVYCLRPPPIFAQGGPVEPLSIPTTCP